MATLGRRAVTAAAVQRAATAAVVQRAVAAPDRALSPTALTTTIQHSPRRLTRTSLLVLREDNHDPYSKMARARELPGSVSFITGRGGAVSGRAGATAEHRHAAARLARGHAVASRVRARRSGARRVRAAAGDRRPR